MNPLDGSADQRVVVDSQPLQIIYDAVRILLLGSWSVSILSSTENAME